MEQETQFRLEEEVCLGDVQLHDLHAEQRNQALETGLTEHLHVKYKVLQYYCILFLLSDGVGLEGKIAIYIIHYIVPLL